MKNTLLPYPNDWKSLLNLFQNCFTKPQFNNFRQATTCMAVSQHSTINRWSALFDKKHQSNLNDFFTVSPWNDADVHTRLSRTTTRKIKDAGIGIIDDTLSRKCRYAREHAKHIRKKDFTIAKIKEAKYRYLQTSAFINGLGNVNLVFSQKYEESKEEWGDMCYLITDILSLSGQRVIELFLLRGGIEGFHREAKQQLGFEHYQLRNDRGIERYLFLVLLVYALLLLLNQQLMRETFESKTIGELCRYLKAECYTTMLSQVTAGIILHNRRRFSYFRRLANTS